MISEHFIASVGAAEKPAASNHPKEAAIFIHDHRPILQQSSVYKKSATSKNCLAVSSTHIFAAQSHKAVVHVYNREKNNQEAIVPFTERITCITLACDDTVLVLGTIEGRLFLWEIFTGRLISTDQTHLQKVTVLTVDSASNFLLSASADSTVHIWSILDLLSFSRNGSQSCQPLRTFDKHQTEVTALIIGHSSSFTNFAITASKDRACLVWDYHTGDILRTYLLPIVPTCLELDATDRFLYIGYDDGSVQPVDLFTNQTGRLSNPVNAADPLAPIQPSRDLILRSPDASVGSVLCNSLSFDCSTLLTGHESGKILAYDCARGKYQSSLLQNPLPGPVTNLQFLPVRGLPQRQVKAFQGTNIVKPKFGAFDNSDGTVPRNYALRVKLLDDPDSRWDFTGALTAPCFSQDLIDEGLSELAMWGEGRTRPEISESEDFMALDAEPAKAAEVLLEEENRSLKREIEALRRLQEKSLDKVERLSKEKQLLEQREVERTKLRRVDKMNGHAEEKDGVYIVGQSSDDED